MPTLAPKACAVMLVESEIMIQAGTCTMVSAIISLGDVNSFVPEVTLRNRCNRCFRNGVLAYTAAPSSSANRRAAPITGFSHASSEPRAAHNAAALYVVNIESPVTEYASARGMPPRTAISARPTTAQIPPGTYFPSWPV